MTKKSTAGTSMDIRQAKSTLIPAAWNGLKRH
eukprot:CAMPEP_0183407546 /NCGR_PEP_ID=MMETSP0370-20130417/17441_1 /TAXON_ID=268820 /ORGANISM="Peridinium aciculiferum, Strain PAER-2" /LENGTH=31 /DNA_ID= /DNA_START= /DNA_END= /DNA_ORIENTATION=